MRPRPRARTSALVAGLLAAGASALGCAPRETRPSILVLVLDTARPERMSAFGAPRPTTPFLERLADEGTRFERAWSSSSWTLPAHASLFSGLAPSEHRARQRHLAVDPRALLLAEQLAGAGWRTAAFSANAWIDDATGLARGFQTFDSPSKARYAAWTKALVADRAGARIEPERHWLARDALEWLAEQEGRDEPLFVFVNLVEAHMPYLPDAEAAAPFLGGAAQRAEAIAALFPEARPIELVGRHYDGAEPLRADELERLRALYDGALRVGDRLAQAVVEAFERARDPAHSLVFVLSDHGEALGEGEHLGHVLNLSEECLRIALLARGPGFAPGARDRRVASITDVHASVLAAAGLVAPAGARGRDLRAPPREPRVLVAELDFPALTLQTLRPSVRAERLAPYRHGLAAALDGRFKLVRALDRRGRVLDERLFDLAQDPRELRPLAPESAPSGVLGALRAVLDGAHAAGGTPESGASEVLADPGTAEALRALGYVGDDDAR